MSELTPLLPFVHIIALESNRFNPFLYQWNCDKWAPGLCRVATWCACWYCTFVSIWQMSIRHIFDGMFNNDLSTVLCDEWPLNKFYHLVWPNMGLHYKNEWIKINSIWHNCNLKEYLRVLTFQTHILFSIKTRLKYSIYCTINIIISILSNTDRWHTFYSFRRISWLTGKCNRRLALTAYVRASVSSIFIVWIVSVPYTDGWKGCSSNLRTSSASPLFIARDTF